ncbi:unnamed protein product, partial [Iphiclides podalirius]
MIDSQKPPFNKVLKRKQSYGAAMDSAEINSLAEHVVRPSKTWGRYCALRSLSIFMFSEGPRRFVRGRICRRRPSPTPERFHSSLGTERDWLLPR